MRHCIPAILFSCMLFTFSACQEEELDITSVEALEEALGDEFASTGLTSFAYCVVKNGTLLHSGAYGHADVDNGILATDQTRYLVASVSKTITGVAAMQLVEQGLIGFDDDIDQYLPFPVRNPAFPNDPITLRMLLSHHSSISDAHQETFELDCFGTDCAMTLEQYFAEVFTSTGQFYSPNNFSNGRPSTVEDYSNLGSALIGYLVERISQTPFDIYCKNNIFTPLGMSRTEWRLAQIPLSELAVPYSDEITAPNPHYTFPDYPNGGLRSTVTDLSRFLRMVMLGGSFNNAQVLSQASVTAMRTRQFGGSEYGLAFYYDTDNGRTLLGHSGGEKGVTAEMFYDTASNVGVIVLSNEEDAPLDGILAMLFNFGERQ